MVEEGDWDFVKRQFFCLLVQRVDEFRGYDFMRVLI